MRRYLPCISILFLTMGVLLFSSECLGLSAADYVVDGLTPIAPNSVFLVFGANTLEPGISATALSYSKTVEPNSSRFQAGFAYGLPKDYELIFSVPYIYELQGELSGFEDIALGLKHRFLNEGKYGPSVSYLLMASLPTGKDEFTTDGALGSGILMSKRVGPVYGHANLLYSRPWKSGLEDEVSFALGFDFSASHSFRILGELYSRKNYHTSELKQMEFRLGYRFLTRENIFTTMGVGLDLKDRSPEYRLMFSVALLLPKTERKVKRLYYEEGDNDPTDKDTQNNKDDSDDSNQR